MDEFQKGRQRMLDRDLRRRGIQDLGVLRAMQEVRREEFVPSHERSAAYEDRALPIGCGQTISQPYTVAFMAESLRLSGDEKVLEIGTGSGYGAAVLSKLAREIHTIERIESLAQTARESLARAGCRNVRVHLGDGSCGLPTEAPFDAIVATAGGREMPTPLMEQLAIGGRLVIPLESADGGQTMWRVTRTEDGLVREDLGRFSFVPLIGQFGWADPD
jgi:protein-L-isoaspartate(D-aspartate) O-methyltransferase